ncbi:hypothetical protein ABMA27_010718 [Loxostege sticticalis]|uniref:RNA-directed DNA polymerase n=1 Tax=Loxostege sticticalis TaxID=481309 RepID=A0ABR3H441_LOXSC
MGGNFLIDTGASRSLISPESIGNFEFGQQITNEPYSISTAHGTSHHNQVAHIPLPPLFGTEPIVHKFLVFDFDSNYKGLIGNDLLRVLGARIDYNKKKLFTRTTAIPLLFDNIIIKRRLSQEAQLNNINTCRDDNELKNNLNRIRTDHLNSEEKREINKLCYQYRDIFYSEKMPLTFTHSVKHKLRLTDETPIFTKNYRKPPCEQVEIQKQVDDLVKKGIVRESMSPWSSPVHIVPKKADASGKVKWRLVIDYRKLNDRTIEDKFPIPNITDILDKLGRAQYFSTIDLASGYHQVEMDERDIEKTAFTTDRHYEFLRMPFGLKNAPSTFQRLMNNILRDLLYDTCIVYLDDILIYSVSLQDHIKKLKRVFDRLREHNFKVQLDKSEFLRKEVIYLGHTLTQEGLKPNEDKIKAIKKFPIPATQKEIKSFLGLVGYYRKFIPDFAKMTKPMTKCLKKNAKVTHTPEFIDSFNKSKDILCNAPVLQYPDFEKPFILTTDASDVSIGAVLSQGTVGTDRPIAYASRTLSQTEIKYSTIEKELLAIVWAVKYFRPYLYGRKFTIYSDHKPLTWLMSLKDPNSKLTRWRLRLEEYDYQIVYKKGKYNTNADALSRIKINALDIEPQPSTSSAQHDLFQEIESITDIPIIESTQSQVVRDDSNDIDVCDVDIRTLLDIPVTPNDTQSQRNENMDGITDNDDVITDDSNKIIPTCPDAIDKQLKQFHIRSSPGNEYRIEDHSKKNFVIKNVFIPINNTEEQVIKFLREHTIADRKFFCYYHNEELFPIFCKVLNSVFDNNRGPKLVRCLTRVTLVDNANEIEQLIKRYHEGKTIHRGIQETYKKLRKNYHWTNMLTTIQKYINDCETCRKSKYERNPIKPPLALTETPEKPMDHMFMDLFSIDGCTFLTIIDNFTKFAQAVMLPAATSIHVAEALLSLLSIIGIPNKITTDSDHKFDNEIIKEICAMHKINIHFTTPYNPNSNSPIERFHSTLGELIRIQKLTDKSDINSLIRNAIIAYNNTIHNATGFTPFELLYGHTSSRNPLELFYTTEFYQDYVQKHKAQMENAQKLVSLKLSIDKEQTITKANKTSEIIPFKIGDKVYKQVAKTARSKKTEPRYLGPIALTCFAVIGNARAAPEPVIQPIDNEDGLLVLRDSKVVHRIDTYTLICVYNTTHIYSIFKQYVTLYGRLVSMEDSQYTYAERYVHREQIKYLIELIDSKFFYILPKNINRFKRGLFNGLGTVIKAISGNLDENDAQKFESEIEKLRKNTYNLENGQKNTISLVKQYMDQYNENLKNIEVNLDMLATNIDNINRNLTILTARIDILQSHIQIGNGLQQIYDKVSTLETAITFASIGTLHPSIIEPIFLLSELIKIESEFKLPVPARRENIHLLENVIGIKAYSTLTSITFILEVPLISPASYDLLHLYSIPNNKNLTRIPKAPLLILGSKEYAYPHEPCQRLDDELSICNHLQLESIQNEDCIVQVIRHAASNNCRYAEVILPPVKIQQVHQNTWLVISRNPEILKVKCGNDEKYQRIQNTYLLTTTEACKLEINGQVLQTHHKTLNIKETIPLPRIHLPESNVTWKNVHLENINLDKLHAIATSISMQPEISNDYGIATKPSWTSIILIAILAAVAAYYARRKFGTIKCTRTKRNARNTPEDIELNAVPRTESTSLAQPLQLQAHTLAEHHRLREPTPTVRSPLGREELCRLSP